jgi:hypothetical protein
MKANGESELEAGEKKDVHDHLANDIGYGQIDQFVSPPVQYGFKGP